MFVTTLMAILTFAIVVTVGMEIHPFETYPVFGNKMLWVAFLSFLAVRGIGLAIQFPQMIRNMNETKKIH